MSLQFILGPSGAGKSYYADNKIIEEAVQHPDRNYILLVPEQYSMALQRKMVTLHPKGGTMNIDVIGFNRLAYRVFDELSVEPAKVLEDFGKTMLIRRVAGQLKDKLFVYGGCLDKSGFIDEVKSLMSEMYQYDISRQKLYETMERLKEDKPEGLLLKKLSDMLTIFRGFDEKIKNQYIVAEQLIELLCSYVPESEYIKNSVIVMDGFTGFTPVQLSLVERLMEFSKDMSVVLTIDEKNHHKKYIQQHELFYLTRQTRNLLVDIADKLHVEVKPDVFISGENESRWSHGGGSRELKFLEENLFRYPYQKYNKIPQSIGVTAYENPRKEITGTCQHIYELVKEGAYRYKDIAVICGNLEAESSYVEQIFSLYDIPYFLDYSRPVRNNPCVDALGHALRIVEDNFSYDSVFAFLKSGVFTQLDVTEIEELENYVLARGIRGVSWWKKPFSQELDEVRQCFMDYILPFYEQISGPSVKITCYVDAIKQLMERLSYQEQLKENAGLYDSIISLLDKMLEIMPEDEVDIRDFNELMDLGLKDLSLGIIPNTLDMVVVGDITRTRLDEVKVLFIIGVNDGVIPKQGMPAQIISDQEKEKLSEYNLELAPTEKMNAYTQQFYLYMNMTKPRDRLYLSYVQMSSGNEPMRPSYIVSRVKNIFPQLSVTLDREEGLKVSTLKASVDSLIPGIHRLMAGDAEDRDEILGLYSIYLKRGDRAVMDKIHSAMNYSNIPEPLKKDVADLIKLRLMSQSISRLEQYAGCAYSYFLRYTIGLRERDIKSIDNRNMGNILHSAMEQLFRHVHDNMGNDWDSLDDKTRDELAENFVNRAFDEELNGQIMDEGRYSYLRDMLVRIGKRTAHELSRLGREDKFSPEYFEYKFEKKLPLDSNGHVMKLTGVVDRCDLYYSMETGSLKLRLIDYKSGNYDFKINELYEGLQLQLSVYMSIVKELVEQQHSKERLNIETSAMYYYQMRDPFIEVKSETELNDNRAKELGFKGLDNKDGEYFDTIMSFAMMKSGDIAEEIMEGNISKNPMVKNDRSPCEYCAYVNICRFDDKNGGNKYRYMRYKASEKEVVYDRMKKELGGDISGVDTGTAENN